MKSTLTAILFLAISLTSPLAAISKNLTVRVDSQNLTATNSELGAYYVFSLPFPEEVLGKRVDSVTLEFFVDVKPDAAIETEYVPSIDVFPLTAPWQVGREPAFSRDYPTSRPIALGEGNYVTIDVTDVVKRWIAAPSSNHGLLIGTFSGPTVGDLDVRSDLLGNGKAIQATFFYQNRFGNRVSTE